MKLTKEILAPAFAATAAFWWFIGSLFIWVLPEFSLLITKWWFMGLDVDELGNFNLDFSTFLFGGLTTIIAGWLTGYILGVSIEYFSKKK